MRRSITLICLTTALAFAWPDAAKAGLLAQLGLDAPLDGNKVAVLTCDQEGDQVKSCYLAPGALVPNCVDDVSAKRFSCQAIAQTLCASGGISAVDLKGNAAGDRQHVDCAGVL